MPKSKAVRGDGSGKGIPAPLSTPQPADLTRSDASIRDEGDFLQDDDPDFLASFVALADEAQASRPHIAPKSTSNEAPEAALEERDQSASQHGPGEASFQRSPFKDGKPAIQASNEVLKKPQSPVEQNRSTEQTLAESDARAAIAVLEGRNVADEPRDVQEGIQDRQGSCLPPDENDYFDYATFDMGNGKPPTVHYCTDPETTERVAAFFLSEVSLGCDMEWKPFCSPKTAKEGVSLVQLASASVIGLFHFAQHETDDPALMLTPTLKLIIESPSIAKVGNNIKGDMTRLAKWFPVTPAGVVDTMDMRKAHAPQLPDSKLATQVLHLFNKVLRKEKTVRTSAWDDLLNADQQRYAANDAYASLATHSAWTERRQKSHDDFFKATRSGQKDAAGAMSRGTSPSVLPMDENTAVRLYQPPSTQVYYTWGFSDFQRETLSTQGMYRSPNWLEVAQHQHATVPLRDDLKLLTQVADEPTIACKWNRCPRLFTSLIALRIHRAYDHYWSDGPRSVWDPYGWLPLDPNFVGNPTSAHTARVLVAGSDHECQCGESFPDIPSLALHVALQVCDLIRPSAVDMVCRLLNYGLATIRPRTNIKIMDQRDKGLFSYTQGAAQVSTWSLRNTFAIATASSYLICLDRYSNIATTGKGYLDQLAIEAERGAVRFLHRHPEKKDARIHSSTCTPTSKAPSRLTWKEDRVALAQTIFLQHHSQRNPILWTELWLADLEACPCEMPLVCAIGGDGFTCNVDRMVKLLDEVRPFILEICFNTKKDRPTAPLLRFLEQSQGDSWGYGRWPSKDIVGVVKRGNQDESIVALIQYFNKKQEGKDVGITTGRHDT